MALSEKEKQIVEKAFNYIAGSTPAPTLMSSIFSCIALECAEKGYINVDGRIRSSVTKKYAAFFGQSVNSFWDFNGIYGSRERKQARLLMLATFYVLEGEI